MESSPLLSLVLLPTLLQELRDQSRPAGLMARTYTCAVVSVEVFIKQEEIAPMRIVLELLCPAIDRATTVGIFEEEPREAAGKFPATSPNVWRCPDPVGHSTRY